MTHFDAFLVVNGCTSCKNFLFFDVEKVHFGAFLGVAVCTITSEIFEF